MKLTKPTVTQIWSSLKGYRLAVNPLLARDGSGSSVVSPMPTARETVTLPDSREAYHLLSATHRDHSREVWGLRGQESVSAHLAPSTRGLWG